MDERNARRLAAPSGATAPTRRDFLRFTALGGLAVGPLAAVLGACGSGDDEEGTATTATAAGEAQRGGEFKVALTYASIVEPHLLADTSGIAVVQPTAAYLVDVSPDYRLAPALATEWSSEDARRWTFALRPDAKFHDGTTMTAEDVAATYRRLVDPALQSTLLGTLSFLKGENVRALDDTTVEFTLERPVSDFPVYTHSYQATILPAGYAPGDFARNANGLGPFRLVDYQPQGDVRYEAHEDYFVADQPYFDTLTLVGFAAEDAIVPALQAGDVDASVLTEFAQLPVLRRDEGVTVHHLRDARHIALTMRTDQEPWTDKRVRQALALSVGRRAYVDGVLGGTGDVGEDHPVSPVYAEYTEVPGRRERDVARARELLSEAGRSAGVSATLSAPSEIADLADLAVYVSDQAREAGFDIKVDAMPIQLFVERGAELNFQTYGWSHRNTPSEFLNAGYRSDGAFNVTGWKNADFDALVDRLDRTVDAAERKAVTLEIEELMAEEVPAVLPFWAGQYRATRADIVGFEPNAALVMPVATARRTG